MSIPFHDDPDDADLGTAAFLSITPTRDGYAGALFQITARGEPVEFTWNQVSASHSILWRPGDLRRAALRLLVTTIFETTPLAPTLLMLRADTLPLELFSEDIHIDVAVLEVDVTTDGEIISTWVHAPESGSVATLLAETLTARGLLLEPFERAAEGLREVGMLADTRAPNPHPPAPSPAHRERG